MIMNFDVTQKDDPDTGSGSSFWVTSLNLDIGNKMEKVDDALKLVSEIGVSKTSEKLNLSTKTLYVWQRAERLSMASRT